MRTTLRVVLAVVLLGCCALAQKNSDEQMIRKLDADWSKAAQTKSADAWMAFYSSDAVVMPPNEKTATTKDAIKKSLADFLALADLTLGWEATKVEVAKSGDIAYLYGTYHMKAKDAKGKPIEDHGKMLEIWKKQADGKWKCAVDTWNSDLPAGQ